MSLGPLGAVVENGRPALDPQLALPQGREPIGLVLSRIALGADAEEPEVEEPDRAPQDAFADQSAEREVGFDALAEPRERLSELLHLLELLPIAVLPPGVVIAVLLAPGVVVSGRLDVTARVGADPHVGPRRGNRERADPVPCLGVLDRIAVLVEVREPPAATDAPDPRRGAIDPP